MAATTVAATAMGCWFLPRKVAAVNLRAMKIGREKKSRSWPGFFFFCLITTNKEALSAFFFFAANLQAHIEQQQTPMADLGSDSSSSEGPQYSRVDLSMSTVGRHQNCASFFFFLRSCSSVLG